MKGKIGLIGRGLVGTELARRLRKKGYEIPFAARSSGGVFVENRGVEPLTFRLPV